MIETAPRLPTVLPKDVTVAILAGGLGTRLRPVVADLPKPLAPVLGRPFLTHLLDSLAASGTERALLLVGHKAEQIRRALGNRYAGVSLDYCAEPQPLGTGGALRHALGRVSSPSVLLLNGDTFCEFDPVAFVRFHRRRRADVSLVLTKVDDAGRFGRVQTTFGGRAVAFDEKGAGGPGWINAGAYLLERDLLREVPAGRPVSLERELLPAWVQSRDTFAYRRSGAFLDVGTPESYAAAPAFFARSAVSGRRSA
jgi:D-glycero-alpha-D-manno-heptose 1-phosphate guanylyltransferase